MKTTKQLNVTKTPIDIKRRLDLAVRHLAEVNNLLASLDQTSFPPGYLGSTLSRVVAARYDVDLLEAHRPLKKTERAAEVAPVVGAEPIAETPSEPTEPVVDTSFDFGANVVEAEVVAAAPSVTELRRLRKLERDRASAARRRAARAEK